MKVTQLTDQELLRKKADLLEDLRKTPSYSLHRKDLLRALDKVEKERARRLRIKEQTK